MYEVKLDCNLKISLATLKHMDLNIKFKKLFWWCWCRQKFNVLEFTWKCFALLCDYIRSVWKSEICARKFRYIKKLRFFQYNQTSAQIASFFSWKKQWLKHKCYVLQNQLEKQNHVSDFPFLKLSQKHLFKIIFIDFNFFVNLILFHVNIIFYQVNYLPVWH